MYCLTPRTWEQKGSRQSAQLQFQGAINAHVVAHQGRGNKRDRSVQQLCQPKVQADQQQQQQATQQSKKKERDQFDLLNDIVAQIPPGKIAQVQAAHNFGAKQRLNAFPTNTFKTSSGLKYKLVILPKEVNPRLKHSQLRIELEDGDIYGIYNYGTGLTHDYWDFCAAAVSLYRMTESPDEKCTVVMLGLGVGTIVNVLKQAFSDVVDQVIGYEIDPNVVQIGRRYFSLSESIDSNFLVPRYEDALGFGNDGSDKAHVLIVDIFLGSNIPPQFLDKALWQQYKNSLHEGGRIVVNTLVDPGVLAADKSSVQTKICNVFVELFGSAMYAIVDKQNAVIVSSDVSLKDWQRSIPKELKHVAYTSWTMVGKK